MENRVFKIGYQGINRSIDGRDLALKFFKTYTVRSLLKNAMNSIEIKANLTGTGSNPVMSHYWCA